MSESKDKQRDETVLSEPVSRRPRDLSRHGLHPEPPQDTQPAGLAAAAPPGRTPQPPTSPSAAQAPQPTWPAPTGTPAQEPPVPASASGAPAPTPSWPAPAPEQEFGPGSWAPADTAAQPQPASGPLVPASDEDGGIATLPPLDEQPRNQSPIDERTGQPKRPLLIWIAAGLPFVGTGLVAVAIGLVLWHSIPDFANASWLNGTMATDPGSWVRVAFSVINSALAALVGGTAAFLGYNIFTGRDWTRIGGIVVTAISFAALMLTPLAAIAIAPIAIGSALTWLPGCRKFFNAWTACRRGTRRLVPVPERVFYGPLPRYR